MKQPAKLMFLALILGGLTTCRSEVPEVKRPPAVEDVELPDILANPKRFNHVNLRVKGVLRVEFEGNSLFQDRETLTSRRADKAIWLNLGWPVADDVKALGGREVVVEGVFDAWSTGHLGAYAGSIAAIRALSPAQQ